MADHSRLGRGLASLMGEVAEEAPATAETVSSRKPRKAPIENLVANPRNPRRTFTEEQLAELSDSIKERGIIQPIVVRQLADDKNFEIIAGERRWRAAQRAGLHEVPIAVVDATDLQSLEFAIIENVQRADLNPIEEGAGYVALMDQCNHTQDEVAKIVGKSRPYVANFIRLTKLSEPVKNLVRQGKISAGHARLLVGQPNALEIAQQIIDTGMSVRALEEDMRRDGAAQANDVKKSLAGGLESGPRGKAPVVKDADTRALERRVSDALGLEVTVDHRGNGGTLHIKYNDLDQLDLVLRKLDK